LMEAAVDVVSLPGKSASFDESQLLERLTGGIGELADRATRRSGRVARDTGWGNAGRNALDKIKTLDDLTNATEELGSHRDQVLTAMRSVIRGVLRGVHWSDEDATLYSVAGLLPRVIVNTMEWYFHMLLHFRTMSRNEDLYERVGKVHLKFHADQLMQIRRYSISRCDMVLKIYVYMRDSASKSFSSIKLLNHLAHQVHVPAAQSLSNQASDHDCDFCHGNYHRLAPCPLRLVVGLKAKQAQGVARSISKEISRDADQDIDALVKEAIANHK
jgi:hypothetical protein